MRRLLMLISTVLTFAVSQNAQAQTATLLADHVDIAADTTITANGNVEVLYGQTRLKASLLSYDKSTNILTIEGPIILVDGDSTVILADDAELEADLRNGIMRGARVVLDQQLQMAAREIQRVDGRYTQLYKTVASSCQICANNPVPLWQIRAERVVHDQQEKLLYFYGAQFRVGNVPIMYIPRLRMPDPTQTRARGFLVPRAFTSSRLGWGVRVPYFIPIGDHADITLTPMVSEVTKSLEGRYRQAFRTGYVEVNGAITRDDLLPDEFRAYAFLTGNFSLPYDFGLRFDLEATSDPAFLLEYGYSGKDRLDSEISITRTRRDEYIDSSLIGFTTLRGPELPFDDPLPNFQGEVDYRKRFYPAGLGGQGMWGVNLQGHNRASTQDIFGRDVLRLGSNVKWSGSTVFGNGLVGRVGGQLAADAYFIQSDSTYAPTIARFVPALEAELRYPMVRTTQSGASEVLEPVLHFGYADQFGDTPPNEDSGLVEFDEGNLFSLSRFPGEDRAELGFRTTAGLHFTHFDPNGWTGGVTLAKVYRPTDMDQFTVASGLGGQSSDWLVAGNLDLGTKFELDTRALLDDDLSLTKAETRIGWRGPKLNLSSSFAWIIDDPEEGRPDKTKQATLNAGYNVNRHWRTNLDYRYDFEAERATRAQVGFTYRNECVIFDLSLSRRFTSSTSVTPTTDIGMSIGLAGFGSDGRAYRRTCSGL